MLLFLLFIGIIFHVILCSSDSPQNNENHQAEGDREQETVEDEDEEDRRFWEEPTPYTPESRLETHRYLEEKRRAKENTRYVFVLMHSMNCGRGNFQRCSVEVGDCLTLNITQNCQLKSLLPVQICL